jgi:uncharacterized membrane protein YbhN (UPF0104 family)
MYLTEYLSTEKGSKQTTNYEFILALILVQFFSWFVDIIILSFCNFRFTCNSHLLLFCCLSFGVGSNDRDFVIAE